MANGANKVEWLGISFFIVGVLSEGLIFEIHIA